MCLIQIQAQLPLDELPVTAKKKKNNSWITS